MLLSCNCLGTPKSVVRWYNAIKATNAEKIILGYKGGVKDFTIASVIKIFKEKLKNNPNSSKKDLGIFWEQANYEFNNSCYTTFSANIYGSYNMAYIYNDYYFYCKTANVIGPLEGFHLTPANDTDFYSIDEFDSKSEEMIR